MSKKQTIIFLTLNPKSSLFYDQHSGVKIVSSHQVAIVEEDIATFPKLASALRHGHIQRNSEKVAGKEVIYHGSANPQAADAAPVPPTPTPQAGEDAPEMKSKEDLEDMTKSELLEYLSGFIGEDELEPIREKKEKDILKYAVKNFSA